MMKRRYAAPGAQVRVGVPARRSVAFAGVVAAAVLGGWLLHGFHAAGPQREPASSVAQPPATEKPVRPGAAAPCVEVVHAWSAVDEAGEPADALVMIALEELRAWARSSPDEAFRWARARTDVWRVAALTAVLESVAAEPATALRLGRELLAAEPGLAADCGTALTGALIRAGAFGIALEFAQSGPVEQRGRWLVDVFSAWTEREPSFARQIAAAILAHGVDAGTATTVVDHWARVAPADAASFALQLPSGGLREQALATTFTRWVAHDPAAAATALPQLVSPAERDTVAAALVCQTDQANRPTQTALLWAETIEAPVLRERALGHVVREWAEHDLAGAALYLANSPRLSAAEREKLAAQIRPRRRHDDI